MKISIALFLLLFIQGDLVVKDAWVRATANEMATALYFVVENNTDRADTLYAVTSSISDEIEIHESFMRGDMMGMRQIEYVVIPPNSTFEFKPKSFHIMILEVNGDLEHGQKAEFTLMFKSRGEVKVTALIR